MITDGHGPEAADGEGPHGEERGRRHQLWARPPRHLQCSSPGESGDGGDQAVDFVRRGVAGATGTNDTFEPAPQPLHGGGRIEVAVRDEEPEGSELPRDLLAAVASDGERGGRRAWTGRQRPVEPDSGDAAHPLPHPLDEKLTVLMQAMQGVVETRDALPPLPQGRDEVDGRGGADNALVIQRAGLEALGRRIGGGDQLGDVERRNAISTAKQDTDVRPVEFVCRAGQEIATDLANIDPPVGRIVNGVDETDRACRMGKA